MVTEHGVEGGAGNEGAKKASADDTAKNAAAE